MNHGTMRFMGFTLHHNPETIEITDTANISQEAVPFANPIIFNIGTKATVVKGEGVFYGANAFEQYLQLKQLYESCKSGVLSISGVNPFNAYLNELKLKCTPIDNYVEYVFTFIEVAEPVITENSTAPMYYIAQENEDLWDISINLSICIDKLVELNPQFSSPLNVNKGDKVRIIDF